MTYWEYITWLALMRDVERQMEKKRKEESDDHR